MVSVFTDTLVGKLTGGAFAYGALIFLFNGCVKEWISVLIKTCKPGMFRNCFYGYVPRLGCWLTGGKKTFSGT